MLIQLCVSAELDLTKTTKNRERERLHCNFYFVTCFGFGRASQRLTQARRSARNRLRTLYRRFIYIYRLRLYPSYTLYTYILSYRTYDLHNTYI